MDEKKNRLIKFGEYIKLKRLEKGLSISQIEKEFKIDKATWSKLEGAKLSSLPKPEFLINISKILGINYIELYMILGYIDKENIIEYLYSGHRTKESRIQHIKP